MVFVKFCGIRRMEDVMYVNHCKPDYAGFVFAPSRRRVTPEEAKNLCDKLEEGIKTVGVFVNEMPNRIIETVYTTGLDVIQLHGDETEADIFALRASLKTQEIWKAVRTKDLETLKNTSKLTADKLLVDAYTPVMAGGTGAIANWNLVRETMLPKDFGAGTLNGKPFFLAGGLNLNNLQNAIEMLNPYGVDLSSGIETEGNKDLKKMMQFMEKIRGNQA